MPRFIPMAKREIVILRDLDELSRKAAEEFIRLAEQAIGQTGRFSVALSGGSTPKGLYGLLAEPEYSNRVAWQHVHLFWGDERCVPPDHPESNYGMAHSLLLSKIPIPQANVHRMPGEKEPQIAAAEYERELIKFFGLKRGEWPRFDLMLMGIGEDGHTASLFPDSDALQNRENLVVSAYVAKLKAWRITLTLPVINHAGNIWFLVAEASKAAILSQILKADVGSPRIPASLVNPVDGRLIWFVTQDAARDLPGK
jgi:6-phosphogluconolactonase